jgi:hypothetical protein
MARVEGERDAAARDPIVKVLELLRLVANAPYERVGRRDAAERNLQGCLHDLPWCAFRRRLV